MQAPPSPPEYHQRSKAAAKAEAEAAAAARAAAAAEAPAQTTPRAASLGVAAGRSRRAASGRRTLSAAVEPRDDGVEVQQPEPASTGKARRPAKGVTWLLLVYRQHSDQG